MCADKHLPWYSDTKTRLIILVGALVVAAVLILSVGSRRTAEPIPSLRSGGDAHLVSFDPEPVGEMCDYEPASLRTRYEEALQEFRSASGSSTPDEGKTTGEVSKREPIRAIRDPYSAYSAVAVDAARNEVVLTDENLFQLLVYDRTANSPPTATMTEPKRVIGGPKTKIEFQCGLYIDPGSGDVFAVNNDTMDSLVIFSRQSKGNLPPSRLLETTHGTFGISVDEDTQELFLTIQHDSAVMVYHKMATGSDSPIRLLQGNHTGLADPHGIAVDAKNDLIYVANHGSVHQLGDVQLPRTGQVLDIARDTGKSNQPKSLDDAVPGSGKMLPPSITVYPRMANGDVPPLRVIQGPNTQMNWPAGLAVDPESGEVYVANDGGNSILVFSPTASGDAAPVRVLKGPKSMIKNPTGLFLDTKNHELWVANFGNHTATVYALTASGDTAPLRMIRSAPLNKPTPEMGNPHPIAYDTKREQLLVPN
jgi:hypothetical protein